MNPRVELVYTWYARGLIILGVTAILILAALVGIIYGYVFLTKPPTIYSLLYAFNAMVFPSLSLRGGRAMLRQIRRWRERDRA